MSSYLQCSLQQYSCSYTQSDGVAQMSGSVQITRTSETELMTAVAFVGPVSVAVDANNNAFRVRRQEPLILLYV